MIYIVQYQTVRCREWVWADTRSLLELAQGRAEDWLKVPCVTESRVLLIDLQQGAEQ